MSRLAPEAATDNRLVTREALMAASAGSGAKLDLRGDASGATETLVYVDERHVGRFRDWRELERVLRAAGLLRVDPAGCQFLLAYGLVPPPRTVYRGVWSLGLGDRLEIDLPGGVPRHQVDFPYLERYSHLDRRFDTGRLADLLGAAVERALPAGQPAVFMQSAGKDSTGLLLALSAAGASHVRCVTYDAGWREREGRPAAELARRFGLAHRIVTGDPVAECRSFLSFAERSPAVVADLTLLAYLHALDQVGVDGGVVLDGLGNDAYMGYVEPRRDAVLGALSVPRLFPAAWGRLEVPALGPRVSYLMKSMLMYPTERALAGSRPAPCVVQSLVPQPTVFGRFFAELDRELRALAPIDRRAWVRGRIFDGAMTMPKGRLAAAHHDALAAFAYCDSELIDWVFHLPREDRYDERRRLNKVALRRLLEREVGESPYLRAKGSFRFDVLRFVEVNLRTIREELAAARPLLRGIDRWVDYYARRRGNYVHAYALTSLFMIAAWLVRRPAEVTAPLRVAAGVRP